mgnify:CR=1 FL=1
MTIEETCGKYDEICENMKSMKKYVENMKEYVEIWRNVWKYVGNMKKGYNKSFKCIAKKLKIAFELDILLSKTYKFSASIHKKNIVLLHSKEILYYRAIFSRFSSILRYNFLGKNEEYRNWICLAWRNAGREYKFSRSSPRQ